jgi:hypothetical protein
MQAGRWRADGSQFGRSRGAHCLNPAQFLGSSLKKLHRTRDGAMCFRAIEGMPPPQSSSRPRFVADSEQVAKSPMSMAKSSQDGMSIALVRSEFMQADQGGSHQVWF